MPRHPMPAVLATRIPARLRERRARSRLTQEKLAELAEVKVETISRIENGRSQPTVAMLWRLTQVLGCTVGEIVDDLPEKVAQPAPEDELVRGWKRMHPKARAALVEMVRWVD